jgi:hypothetical protein
MVSIEMRLKAERRMRQILAEERMAQPDVVQYGSDCILFYWHGAEKAVIANISEDGKIRESRPAEPPLAPDCFVPGLAGDLPLEPHQNGH